MHILKLIKLSFPKKPQLAYLKDNLLPARELKKSTKIHVTEMHSILPMVTAFEHNELKVFCLR